MVPKQANLEFLLINSLVINVVKVQAIVEKFIRDKDYKSIFCMTETKVDSHDFEPKGIKKNSKHRTKKDKKGGGLAIGYRNDIGIKLEEIKIKNKDVLALEGTILNTKIRIILCYFDSTKLKSGTDFNRNRRLQKDIEKLLEVEPDTSLVCLGDFNGRLTRLEPNIITDANGKMLENWTNDYNLHHLNTNDKCTGKYTFHSLNGKSAIDHVLINNKLLDNYISMYVDEDRTMLSISDHSLVRVWFRFGTNSDKPDWKGKKSKIITWISREEDRMEIFESSFQTKIGKKIYFKKCMNKMKNTLNSTMRRSKRIKLRSNKNVKLLAAEWVDDELIGNIKLRSQYSKDWRHARKKKEPPEIIEQYKNRYLKQQRITSIMAGDKKSQWEKDKISETWKDSKKFWKMIKELLGKNKELVEEAYIYTEDGSKVEIMNCEESFVKKWIDTIYQRMEKTDFSFWYGDSEKKGLKQQMEEEMEQESSEIMETPIISEKEFVDTINNMKNCKASGIDNIPAELMKVLIKNSEIRKYLLKCFNKALTEEIHEDWLLSRTTMIPKTKKPKILEHRPIAVTVNSSKIVCSILRKKIEDFLAERGIKYENQFGFTEGGRVEHCLFILDYITNMTFEKIRKRGKSLFFAFIDFKKAYDSIDRKRLIEVLVKFKINPLIIDLIVQMYEGDSTIIQLGRMRKKIEVTGGIRQGCCISTLLFKMVTFTIIDDLRKMEKYHIGEFNDNSLWLADDATLIADSLPNLMKLLECLEKTGRKDGLEINKEKTKIMRIRGPEVDMDVGDLETVTETKYLGVTVGGRGRNIFEKENRRFLQRAEEKVNSLMAQIKKSADKVIVGKAIWKLMALPAILFGRAVIPTCESLIEGLQRLENRVWRYLLDIGGYSTVEALRGEMGASMVRSRIMETMLLYTMDTLKGKFQNVKDMMLDTISTGKGRWFNATNRYREELKITWEDLERLSKPALKKMVKEYDTDRWLEGMTKKISLRFYIQGKYIIGYENCYRNNTNSTFLVRARTNSLRLEEHNGRGNPGYDKTCRLCRKEEEDIVHFIIDCKELEEDRNYDLIDDSLVSSEGKMIELLFHNENFQEIGYMIKKLWKRRYTLLEYIKRSEELKKKNLHIVHSKSLPAVSHRSDPGPVKGGHVYPEQRSKRYSVDRG